MDELDANRRHWDDLAAVHVDAEFYDVPSVVDGASSLRAVEREELSDLFEDWAAGRRTRVAHLQCHVGLDTVSLAREGADVVGLDFSAESVARAREIAERAGVDARFVESDVYDAPQALDGRFDLVFCSYGVLCWLPDVREWAGVVAALLRPGGTLYLVDYHPFTDALGWEDCRPAYDYFADEPAEFDEDGSYADEDASLDHTRSYLWVHPVGEVVTALVDAGLELEFLHEFPHAYFRRFADMEADDDGRYRLPDVDLPQLYSVRAARAVSREARTT